MNNKESLPTSALVTDVCGRCSRAFFGAAHADVRLLI
jgi:hypothetical protein